MIKINEVKIERKHFPDNTQLLKPEFVCCGNNINVMWVYENDEEMITLMYLMKHFENINKRIVKTLTLYYIPNARMDRVKNKNEVFTLKYFCDFINNLNFNEVIVFDPHSDVSVALLNNVTVIKPLETLKQIPFLPDVYYFPDAGAKKRYSDICGKNDCVCYGEKIREWETGKILGLEIKQDNLTPIDLKGKTVLLIDDIISYGGTMYYSILKLKEMGVADVSIYCSHLENSVLNEEKSSLLKLLNDGTINTIYTTNSLFTGKHHKIVTLDISNNT